jgi:hypothetical protein
VIVMNCDKIKPLLSRSIDGLLNPNEQVSVAAHLKSCPECTAYYKKLLKLHQAAQDFAPSGDPAYWTVQKDKIIDRINQQEKAKIVPVTPKKSYGYIFKWTAVAASVALVAFISIHEYRAAHPETEIFKPKSTPVLGNMQNQPVKGETVDSSKSTGTEISKPRMSPVPEKMETSEKINTTMSPVAEPKMPVEKKKVGIPVSSDFTGNNAINREESSLPTMQRAAPLAQVQKSEPVQRMEMPKPIEKPPVQNETKLLSAFQAEKDAEKNSLSKSAKVAGIAVEGQVSDIDSISKENNLETYAEWRGRLEYLEARYGNVLSGHIYEAAAKSRTPETSLRATIARFADAYYNIARLTPLPAERTEMIGNLQTLLRHSDAVVSILVKNYIGFLQTSK